MKIAIITPQETEKAETFIQNHISFLPFDKIVIYGGKFPYLTEKDIPTLFKRRRFKLINSIKSTLGLKTKSFNAYHLSKILSRNNIDLVFAEYLITGAEVHQVCKTLKIPIIAIALGYEISQYNIIKQYASKYKSLFEYAKYIMVVSEHMKTNLLALGCPEQKIICSPAGPADTFFELQPTFETKQVLAIGRFVEKKAPHLTIEAFNRVLKQHPKAILVMAGDGPLLDKCQELVKTLVIEHAVFFKGRINQIEQRQLLQDSYLFVQHSLIAENGDSEGTPVAILEASAAGLPIVSTIHAGIPKVVLNAQTGYLVPETDVDLMAEKMIHLLTHKDEAIQFGNYGRTYVKANFTLEKHIDKISNCITN